MALIPPLAPGRFAADFFVVVFCVLLAETALPRGFLDFPAAAAARTAGLDDDARPVRVVRPRAAFVEAALEVKSNPVLIRVVALGVPLCAAPTPLHACAQIALNSAQPVLQRRAERRLSGYGCVRAPYAARMVIVQSRADLLW